MSYREQDDGQQVTLTMSPEDYERLMKCVIGAGHTFGGDLDTMLAFINRLNSGNPNYTSYLVGKKKSAPRQSPQSSPTKGEQP
jgi:hypothetical protein